MGDQLCGYYSYKIKSNKLYKYIVFFLFNVIVTNAYILRKSYHSLAIFKNIKESHVQLAKELIGNYCSQQLRCGRNGGTIGQLSLRHFPVKIRDDNNKLRRGRCPYHNTVHHARVDSSWYYRCDTWLCHTGNTEDCFLMWHTKQYQ